MKKIFYDKQSLAAKFSCEKFLYNFSIQNLFNKTIKGNYSEGQ